MAKKKSSAPDNYEVGRGKPPKETRFKPGQSGNPKGRPKGSRNLSSFLLETLLEEIEMNENGRTKRMPLIQFLIKKQVQLGIQGNPRAIEDMLNRFERSVPDNDTGDGDLLDEDEIILARHLGPPKKSKPKPDNDDYPETLAETRSAKKGRS